MGFEFGFCKYSCDDPNRDMSLDNYYWSWCGWENTDFFNAFARLSQKGFIPFGEEGTVAVKDLAWIDDLYNQVQTSKHYHMIAQLAKLNWELVGDYLESLSDREMAEFRASFAIDNVSDTVYKIIGYIVREVMNGTMILPMLYEAYWKMLEDGVETVYLYNG